MDQAVTDLVFFVNGKKIVEKAADPEWSLLSYLREKLRLCGTKLGCGEGGCGACTVMLSKYDRLKEKVIHFPAVSCLLPVCSVHGLAVTTVEGIGSTKTKLHPVQERIAKAHGTQCGFCTPGMVMSMYSLLRNNPEPSMWDLDVALEGNLCRCTGYRPIVEGYRTFTNACPMGDKCCKVNPGLFDSEGFDKYDPTQEPIFPPELKVHDVLDKQALHFKGAEVRWFRPVSLAELLELKRRYPDAELVVGNTDLCRRRDCAVLVSPVGIPEMYECKADEGAVRIGASATLEDVEGFLRDLMKANDGYKLRIVKAIVDMLYRFATKQVRSVASVGGNLLSNSATSDLKCILLAAQARLHLERKSSRRTVVVNEEFFRQKLDSGEVLVAVEVPYAKEHQYFYAEKQARKRDSGAAIVNWAVNVTINPITKVVEDLRIALGGVEETTKEASKTCAALIGLEWNGELLDKGCSTLLEDLPLADSAPGGMVAYRKTLAASFFIRTYLKVSQQLNAPLTPSDLSGIGGFDYVQPKSSQYFHVVPASQERTDTIGRPVHHAAALKHATGEAVFCDDIPRFEDELYMGLVLSTEAHAEILSLDATEALRCDKVHGFVSAEDLSPERNSIGPVFRDEEIFASKTVTSQGQIVGAVLAEDKASAQKAARKVKVAYRKLTPVIVTNDDAIEHGSIYPKSFRKIENGNVDRALKEAPRVLEGECRTGWQEHFYMETQSVVVNPKGEDDEYDVYSSTQYLSLMSEYISRALQVPENRICVKVKRVGGAFGGKESRSAYIAVAAAVAAAKYKRPVRIKLDRDEDMKITGGRHPFLFKYKVAFSDEGRILGIVVNMYSNAGYSYDVSPAGVEKALLEFDNAYKIPNIRASGWCCKTNLPSNTAFRGFGAPQGMFAIETIVRDIADHLGKDAAEISELNMYREGDVTHYNQTLTYCTLRRCWRECLESSDYERRKADVEKFNESNNYKKRGISVVPTMFGVGFTASFLNQAGALLLVYRSGSVLLTHGGAELGQGLHTKMIQVASRALGIPPDKIHISETATDKVPNTSPSSASVSSDLNGMAVLNACQAINERLEPIKERYPEGTWEEWVETAYLERTSLFATGFYERPDFRYNFETNEGSVFSYYTYGVAVSEVEIDVLTGDHLIRRTDIVMDVGDSLNPAIDVGQIEGAFMQGFGLFVVEEMLYSPSGTLHSRGPNTYKIPGVRNIPAEFNVSLLKGAPNPSAVYSSKAIGEPPLFLSSSVFFAIKEAIKAARTQNGIERRFRLDAPATAAKIRMSCGDGVAAMVERLQTDKAQPWNVIP